MIRTPAGKSVFYPMSSKWVFRSDTSNQDGYPITATVSNVATDIITITTNTSRQFFGTYMNGNSYAKIKNLTKGTTAWIKNSPAINTLQVTNSSDISAWANGDTLSTQTGSNSDMVEIDIQPLMDTGDIDGKYDMLWALFSFGQDVLNAAFYTGIFGNSAYGGPILTTTINIVDRHVQVPGIVRGDTRRYLFIRVTHQAGVQLYAKSGVMITGQWKTI
jgi:hypothetical protein